MADPYIFSNVEFPPPPKLKDPTVLKLPVSSDLRKMQIISLEKGKTLFSVAESCPAAGGGVSPHIHHCVHEWFYAPEGGLTMLYSPTKLTDVYNPPDRDKGTLVTLYLVPLKPGQGFFGPANYIHGFVNLDKVARPLRTVFIADEEIPSPFPDGGCRAMFETMSESLTGPIHYLPLHPENWRQNMLDADLKFNTNHSHYFFQFVKEVKAEIPECIKYDDKPKLLIQLLDIVREYNAGSKEIVCY